MLQINGWSHGGHTGWTLNMSVFVSPPLKGDGISTLQKMGNTAFLARSTVFPVFSEAVFPKK